MKTKVLIFLTTILSCFLFILVAVTSCTKSKSACDGVNCQNGGTCNGGNCTCPFGYVGTYCQTTLASSVAGAYTGTDCQGNPNTITILTDPSSPVNVYQTISSGSTCHISIRLDGSVTNFGSVDFPTKVVVDNCGNILSFAMTGSVTGNMLSATLIVAFNGNISTCVFNGRK